MKNLKRLSVILSAVMLMTSMPASAMAEAIPDETEDRITEETETETETETEEPEDPMAWYREYSDMELEDLETVRDADAAAGEAAISTREYRCYLYNYDNRIDLPLYFVDDVTDLPFIEMNDLCDLMVRVYHDLAKDAGYDLSIEKNGPLVELSRENGYSLLIDFEDGTMLFDDYDAFTHRSTDTYLLESVSTFAMDAEGNELFLKRNEKGSYDRYGREVEIRLSDYAIPLYRCEEPELYLFPMQTMSDFLLSPIGSLGATFNEKVAFVVNHEAIRNSAGLTRLGMMFASGPTRPLSEVLANFGYNELCLVMDQLYGLKDLHGITSFDELFTEIGYKDKLLSTDPEVKDGALYDFIRFYLDDQHSGKNLNSFRTIEPKSKDGYGLSAKRTIADNDKYAKARSSSSRAVPAYEEVGDTAYVTFDYFNLRSPVSVYYNGEYGSEYDPADQNIDTVGLIIYAHEQITRENSPIKNVVMDLSLNGGGAIDAAVVAASWFLGEAEVSAQSTLTGARSTSHYQADVNLDGKFDEKDTVSDKNLYCLISPNSFSCGNLIPAIFKYSHDVTLLGQTSGGGSCAILGLVSAWGTFFQISSPINMSYVKNGSYYEIDNGVEPDYYINKPANYYDREALRNYLNGLF